MTSGVRHSSTACAALLAAAAVAVPLVFSTATAESFAIPKLVALGAVVAAGIAIAAVSAIRSGAPFDWRFPDTVAAGYGVLVVVSHVFSVDRAQSLWGEPLQRQGLVAALIYVASYFLARAGITDRSRLVMLIRAVALGATLVAGYAIVQELGLDPVWPPPVTGRTFSTIGQPNSLGAYLAAAVPVTLVLAARRGALGGVVWVAAAVVQIVGILTTASRGAQVALAAAVIVAVLVAVASSVRRSGRLLATVAVAMVIVAASVVWLAPVRAAAEELVGRIMAHDLDLAGQSETHRDLWRVAGHITVDHPVVGTGPDTYALVFPAYRELVLAPDRAAMFARFRVESPHNVYLATASGSGVPALAAYLLLVGVVLVSAVQAADTLGAGVVGAVVGYAVSNFFITAELTGSFILWLVMGASLALRPGSEAPASSM